MNVHPVRSCRTLLLALILLFALAAGGCEKTKNVRSYSCSNQIVKVDSKLDKGVDHKAVYLCNGYTVQWVMSGDVASFEIVFQDPPFGNATNFGTGPGETTTTPPYSAPVDLTVYKYTVSGFDKNGAPFGPFDPHVVGGGGL